ncbi:MAG TPA: YMGG-like glycine zipper-containing protein [Pyrinomonadaceae bacterium]|nr:YMGG-like glycine zipper-containing protein [Pyrinomonadaceae bacterium]
MNRARQIISVALMLALTSIGITSAQGQTRAYRMTDRQIDALIRRVENSADRFRQSAAFALDRSRYNGTASEDEINRFIQNFEAATDQLRDRFNRRASVSADVENVLRQAAFIDQFVVTNRLGGRVQSDWTLVRTDLDALARAYNVAWRWDQAGTMTGGPVFGSQRAYRVTDQQLDTLIRRIETRTDNFRTALDRSLDRTRYDGTRTEDDINRFVRDFEQATDTLRSRFGSRTSVAGDVENVLRQATLIDSFMRRNRMNQRAENQWSLLRTDLNELASTYSVAWNWDNPNTLPGPVNSFPGGTNAANRLTGTYRLDVSRSEDPRAVAQRATANLPTNQRQRVYERLIERLESPEMLAIDRRGSQVTIASSRAPQTTFDADGRERPEQLPNGMQARVSSVLNGDRLVVRSTGFRENDFTVTFDPIEGGRSLRVTREIWSERLGANPVVVQNTYTRTSEVADLNVYNSAGPYTAGSPTIGTSTSGDFVIANGTTLIATLNSQLSTQTTQNNDRFTMTVREPAQFEGAVIEGHVTGVDRSGRVAGRSQITFNFDRIRLRDGRTYNFAGWVESVRTTAGETVSVDNEGTVRDDNQTNRTVQRTAIGTAVGAIIGAIAGGGKGAAIGAVLGAGAGAGSVYVQGRDDLELQPGTELTIRASSPNR